MAIDVAVFDTERIYCHAIAALLATYPAIRVIAQIVGEECLKSSADLSAEVLVISQRNDHALIDDLQWFSRHHGDTKCVIIGDRNIPPSMLFDAGAIGFVHTKVDPDILVCAIESAHRSRYYIDPESAQMIVLSKLCDEAKPWAKLSTRENQIVRLLLDGMTEKEIGQCLHLSPKTVSTYKCRSMEKLCVHNHAELLRFAMENHII